MTHYFKLVFSLLICFIIHSVAYAIERVSVASDGTQANNETYISSMSDDGRFVAFHSRASNLVVGDTNGNADVFVHDRTTGATQRVSVSSTGIQSDGAVYPTISADGRYVAFYSSASNLVPGDTNDASDVFVHDRTTGMTQMVSVSSFGVQGNEGLYGTGSSHPFISADGRYVAFRSESDNLVPGDTNNEFDAFVHDRQTGITERISISPAGVQGNGYTHVSSISSDGRFVAFHSEASNLVDGDTNNEFDAFIHDRNTGMTERVSVSSTGAQGDSSGTPNGNGGAGFPKISDDGRFVVFSSYAHNMVANDNNTFRDVFVHDRKTGVTEIVSVSSSGVHGNAFAIFTSISADGRFVAFTSDSSNLDGGDTNGERDVFIHDRTLGRTQRVSVSDSGEQGNDTTSYSSISANGRFISVGSDASNLVVNDSNRRSDIFVIDNPLAKPDVELSVVVKPSSAVASVDQKLRFRALFTNHSDQVLTNCRAHVVKPVFVNGQRQFKYYSVLNDGSGNSVNKAINILPGKSIRMTLVVIPRVALQREIKFNYVCDQTRALTIPYENTVLITAKTQALIAEDFIQLKNGNGRTQLAIDRNDDRYWTSYTLRLINTGLDASSIHLRATGDLHNTKLRQTRFCETQGNGSYQCLQPLNTELYVALAAGESKKVQVFVSAVEAISKNLSDNRIYVEARDRAGELVAINSIGVFTLD